MKKLIAIIICALTFNFVQAQNQEVFAKVFVNTPANGMMEAKDLEITFDHGFIITGKDDENIYGTFLVRTDSVGDTLWTKRYTSTLAGQDVFTTCENGFLSIGENSFIKTDSVGIPVSIKEYNDINNIRGEKTNSCGYILAGNTVSVGSGGSDIYIIKVDSSGFPLWGKTYGGFNDDYLTSFLHTSDDNYIVFGYSQSFTPNNVTFLYKIDPSGNILWSKTIDANRLNIYSAKELQNGSYACIGSSDSGIVIMKLDEQGAILESKIYGSPSVRGGFLIEQATDGGIIFTNTRDFPVKVDYSKTDTAGNILWSYTTYVENEYNFGQRFVQVNDDGFVLLLYGISHHFQSSSFAIDKMNSNGILNCGDVSTTIPVRSVTFQNLNVNTFSVVQNPTFQDLNLSFDPMVIQILTSCSTVDITNRREKGDKLVSPTLVSSKDVTLQIVEESNYSDALISVFDINGRNFMNQVLSGNGKNILVSIKQHLSPGMYFIRIMHQDKVDVVKFIVL